MKARDERSRAWVLTIQIGIVAVILGLHYRYVIDGLITIWQTNGDWSHGFIIPLFSLYYLYMQRDRVPTGLDRHRLVSSVVGAALLSAAFAVFLVCTAVPSLAYEYPKRLSLVLTVLAVVLMAGGWPITRWSWFAVAFLVFAMPLPETLYVQMTMPLRFIAARVSAALLSGAIPDMLAQARGALVEYVYQNKPGTLDIEQACSGIRLMMTMMALGVAMAFVSDRPVWQRLTMILACVPIAIFCNIVRVTTTGFMVVLGRDDLARGHWHTMLGLGMLFIAFTLYGGISYVLNHLVVEEKPDDRQRLVEVGGAAS